MRDITYRISLTNGDVRQGRYMGRDKDSVTVYDGLPRRILFTEIDTIDQVPSTYEASLSAQNDKIF